MQIKQTPLSDLHTNEANPRTITDGKFGKLIDSLLTFPKMLELRPIVTDREGVALGGNMRVRALQAIAEMDMDEITARCRKSSKWGRHDKKWQDMLLASWESFLGDPSAPAVVADELSPDEYNEFVIKDNASFGEWDWDALANNFEIENLEEWGVDNIKEIGKDEADIPETQPDLTLTAITANLSEEVTIKITDATAEMLLNEMRMYQEQNNTLDGFWDQRLNTQDNG